MESKFDIVDTALAAGNFSTLASALVAADLIATLKGDGPFTVFAPTDDAFAKIPAETISDLLLPENKEKLTAILLYHVVPGKVTSEEVVKLTEAKSVQGAPISINAAGGVKVNEANVTTADVEATNGVIHIIDAVLMPPVAAAA